MSANSWGQRLVGTTFGESHGTALGAVVDGCPAGLLWDQSLITRNLQRRRPGNWDGKNWNSSRAEADQLNILSGVFEGKTLGTPIAMVVFNQDARSADYDSEVMKSRSGHSDDLWKQKFIHSDPRGGGRASGRETLGRVLVGSVAQMIISQTHPNLGVRMCFQKIGPLDLGRDELERFETGSQEFSSREVFFPENRQQELSDLLAEAKEQGESWGGRIWGLIENVPAGLGQPVFHKLKSELASAWMSVGTVHAVDFSNPLAEASNRGSHFHQSSSRVYSGIRGGISTGEKISFQLQLKPPSSILQIAKKGRHDPFVGIRALPVLEAMTNWVLADQVIWHLADRMDSFPKNI